MDPFNWRSHVPPEHEMAQLELRPLTQIDNGAAVYEGHWNLRTQEREGLGV